MEKHALSNGEAYLVSFAKNSYNLRFQNMFSISFVEEHFFHCVQIHFMNKNENLKRKIVLNAKLCRENLK